MWLTSSTLESSGSNEYALRGFDAALQATFRLESDKTPFLALLEGTDGVEECILQGLQDARRDPDWFRFELYVIAAGYRPSSSYVPVLADVLSQRAEKLNNEDIIDVLGSTGDSRAVSALEDAAWWSPGWDEFHGLAQKCIMSLEELGGAEARAALRRLTGDGPEEVREWAQAALDRLTRD